mmetsp:Transcript_21517/g.64372  ORF Transcript_21517/g.64372 Transcript_21517/m.64372 type:complete len:328 (+) Transcript_21517:209-1192(+)
MVTSQRRGRETGDVEAAAAEVEPREEPRPSLKKALLALIVVLGVAATSLGALATPRPVTPAGGERLEPPAVWSSRVTELAEGTGPWWRGPGHLVRVYRSEEPLTWAAAVDELASADGGLGEYVDAVLGDAPYDALYWETPPLTAKLAADVPFEFVTLAAPGVEIKVRCGSNARRYSRRASRVGRPAALDSSEHEPKSRTRGISTQAAPSLARKAPDPSPFSAHLARCDAGAVTSFPNARGDTQLVAPCRAAGVPEASYTHLAAFARHAPAAQRLALWKAVGETLEATLAERGDAPTWVSTAGGGVKPCANQPPTLFEEMPSLVFAQA